MFWASAVAAVILIVLVCLLWFGYHPRTNDTVVDWTGRAEVSVVLEDEGFVPPLAKVSRGTRVIFSTTRPYSFWPASNEHPAHGLYPQFDAMRPLEPSESFEFVFDREGRWRYHDHVRSYYTGTIYVE